MADKIITWNVNRTDLLIIDDVRYTRVFRAMNGTNIYYYVDEDKGVLVNPPLAKKLENKYHLILSLLGKQN